MVLRLQRQIHNPLGRTINILVTIIPPGALHSMSMVVKTGRRERGGAVSLWAKVRGHHVDEPKLMQLWGPTVRALSRDQLQYIKVFERGDFTWTKFVYTP